MSTATKASTLAAGDGRADTGRRIHVATLRAREARLPVHLGSEPVRVVVVVPTYNEAENVSDLVRSIRAALPVGGIIVVDDASPDGTADLAEALVDEIGDLHVVRRQGKSGSVPPIGTASARAMESGCDVVVQMDADFSHDPAMIPALVANVEHGADLAIGSRYVPGARTLDWPRDRQCALSLGQPVRRRGARSRRQRRHRQGFAPIPPTPCVASTMPRFRRRGTRSKSR